MGDNEEADASGVLLREELEDLNEKENMMDQMIAEAEEELGRLKGGAGSYVTYSDLKGIPLFQNKTVIVIQAPPDSLWESSPPGGQVSFQAILLSALYIETQQDFLISSEWCRWNLTNQE